MVNLSLVLFLSFNDLRNILFNLDVKCNFEMRDEIYFMSFFKLYRGTQFSHAGSGSECQQLGKTSEELQVGLTH